MDGVLGRALIASEKEFNAAVADEQARTERYGSRFSLLSFRAGERQMTRREQRLLRAALRRRLRATDLMGQVGDGALLVLLPEADEHGARKVAADVFVRLPKHAAALSLSVQHWAPKTSEGL